ncbi:hypothetical protein JMJ35_010607 [Cladonia borealis]|uniref:Uncharacterized protein n=1 Tax=Cladonia borealis TaxID=184061 RepID=A0AA39UX49_9LECA|nr:hypothetical protein JMJ35_010607 [Cladonia borealis]
MATQVPNTITGITIKSAPHSANLIGSGYTQPSFKPITTVDSLLATSCFRKSLECKTILPSTYEPYLSSPETTTLYASTNGFVKGSIDTYNQHHHLIIRPEDVWFAILTQFSCYVSVHAEELVPNSLGMRARKSSQLRG